MKAGEVKARVDSLAHAIKGQPDDFREGLLRGYELSLEGRDLRQSLLGQLAAVLTQLEKNDSFFGQPSEEASLNVEISSKETQTEPSATERDRVAIRKAREIHEAFLTLPETRPVKKKKMASRDRNFILKSIEKISANKEGEEQLGPLSSPHALTQILETWLALANPHNERSELLINLATELLTEFARNNWSSIDKKTLAELIQGKVHAGPATAIMEEILKSYCEGPRNSTDLVRTHTHLCLAGQYIFDDQKAIDYLLQIATFTTPVLPRKGKVHRAYTNDGLDVSNIEVLHLAHASSAILDGLAIISSLGISGGKSVDESLIDLSNEVVAERIRRIMHEYGCLERKAREIYDNRMNLLPQVTAPRAVRSPSEEVDAVRNLYGDEVADWFAATTYNLSPEKREYLEAFGYRTQVLLQKNLSLGEAGVDVVSLLLEGETAIDVFVPEGVVFSPEDYQNILRQAQIKVTRRSEVESSSTLHSMGDYDPHRQSLYSKVTLDGNDIISVIRPACRLDSFKEHALNQLMWGHIPDIEGEEFTSAQEIAQRIKENQRWYVGPRAFEVEFKSDNLREAGFEKIAFHRPEDDKNIHVTLTHQGQTIEYKINANWQLDLEGKGIHSAKLKDIIERRTLAVLEAYSTPEVLETSKGIISEKGSSPGIGFVPAKVVWVGGFKKNQQTGEMEPKGFTPEQWQEYFDKEGKDLAVIDAMRQLREDSQGRHSTYRTWYGLKDGPAIKLFVNDPRIV